MVPQQHSRLWGGVSLRYTNMSDASVNSSLARQSYTVQQLLKASAQAALVNNGFGFEVEANVLRRGVACLLSVFDRYRRASWPALLRMHSRRTNDAFVM